MSVNLFSNTLSATYSQQVIKRAVKNHVENLTSAKENISGTKNSSDVFVARRDKQSTLPVANTYVPPSWANKTNVINETTELEPSEVTNTTISLIDSSETSEEISLSENLESLESFRLITKNSAFNFPPRNGLTSINQFFSFLYAPDVSKFNHDKNLEQQKVDTTKVRDHHGITFGEMPVEIKDYTGEYVEYLKTSGKDYYSDEIEFNNARKSLINRELSCNVSRQNEGGYCIGVIATGNSYDTEDNGGNKYSDPTSMEKILIGKLAENNISLNSKEGFVINISAEGVFTLGDHNIKDNSKVDEIKKLIETDEGLQKELTDICSSLARPLSYDDNGNMRLSGSGLKSDGSLSDGSVVCFFVAGNDGSNRYVGPANMEQILIDKLAENNISLDSKDGFTIKIGSDGVVTLSNFSIKDDAKFNEVKKMLETDEGLQRELANIYSSLPTSETWSFDDNGNVTSKSTDTLTLSPFGLVTNADTFRDGNSAISDFIGLTLSEFHNRLNARS